MALDLTTIPDYKNQDNTALLSKMHFGFRTADLLKNKIVDIKGHDIKVIGELPPF